MPSGTTHPRPWPRLPRLPLATALWFLATTSLVHAQDGGHGAPTWSTDLAEARRLAKQRGVPILACLTDADEAGGARAAFERAVGTDEPLESWLRDFVPLALAGARARGLAQQTGMRDGLQLAMLDANGRLLARLEGDEPVDLAGVRALAARAAEHLALRERSRAEDPTARLALLLADVELRNTGPEVAWSLFTRMEPRVDAEQRADARRRIARAMHEQGAARIRAHATTTTAAVDGELQRLALRMFRAGLVPEQDRGEVLSAAAERALLTRDLAALDRILAELAAIDDLAASHAERAATLRAERDRLAAEPKLAPTTRLELALPVLRQLLRDGIRTTTPNTNVLTRAGVATVFDGSYDWHSCIAAHWAALSMARVDGDEPLERFVLERLTPEALERERATMARAAAALPEEGASAAQQRLVLVDARARFTPYVDGWMLMLLSELGRRSDRDTAPLRAFRSECEDRILTYLERSPFPELPATERRPEAAFSGSYRSWLFGVLVLRLCDTTSPAGATRLAAVARDVLEPQRAALTAGTPGLPDDFLDLRAVLSLVDRLEGRTSTRAQVDPQQLPPWVSLYDVHQLGVLISRLWPLAHDAATDANARADFEARAAELLARPDLWAEDFVVVTHWIPQFLWLGVWLSRGRP